MFQIGDLVEYQLRKNKIVGFVECVIDGKVGVRWLNNSEYYFTNLSVFNNSLDYLRKVDSIDELNEVRYV
jgi:hypothetical protein